MQALRYNHVTSILDVLACQIPLLIFCVASLFGLVFGGFIYARNFDPEAWYLLQRLFPAPAFEIFVGLLKAAGLY